MAPNPRRAPATLPPLFATAPRPDGRTRAASVGVFLQPFEATCGRPPQGSRGPERPAREARRRSEQNSNRFARNGTALEAAA